MGASGLIVEAVHPSLQVGPLLLFFFHLAISIKFGEGSCHGVGNPSPPDIEGGRGRGREAQRWWLVEGRHGKVAGAVGCRGREDNWWIRHRNEEREKLLKAVAQRWIRQQEPSKIGEAGASRLAVGGPSALAVAPAIPAAPLFLPPRLQNRNCRYRNTSVPLYIT